MFEEKIVIKKTCCVKEKRNEMNKQTFSEGVFQFRITLFTYTVCLEFTYSKHVYQRSCSFYILSSVSNWTPAFRRKGVL